MRPIKEAQGIHGVGLDQLGLNLGWKAFEWYRQGLNPGLVVRFFLFTHKCLIMRRLGLMSVKNFPIGELLRSAWDSFKHRFGFWCGLLGISVVLTALPWVVAALLSPEHMVALSAQNPDAGAADALTSSMNAYGNMMMQGDHTEMVKHFTPIGLGVGLVLMLVLDTLVGLGWTNTTMRKAYDEDVGFRDYFRPIKRGRVFFSYLIGSILYALIIAAGTVLLVFPAVIWGLRYSQWSYYVVRHGLGPINALHASALATSGAKWDLLGLSLILLLLFSVGFLAFYVGAFAVAMFTWVVKGYIFRKLNDQVTLPAELGSSIVKY